MIKLTPEEVKECLATTPQITFEVTERCNLNCTYCGYGKLYSDKDSRSDRNLHADDAIAFLSFIKKLWEDGYDTTGESVVYISFYGGEPLLNMPFIKEIVFFVENQLQSYNKHFVFSMTTNAILLPHYIKYLVEKDFHLLLSLDGDENGSSYRIYRNGKPAYKTIVDNINIVKSSYPAFYKKNITFNAVLNDRNTIQGINDFFSLHFCKKPFIGEINVTGINPNEIDLFKKIFRSKTQEVAKERGLQIENFQESTSYDTVARYLQMHSPYFYLSYNELLYGKNSRKSVPTGTCLPFGKKVFITVSGKILPCEHMYVVKTKCTTANIVIYSVVSFFYSQKFFC